ncbi:hypothetical protein [Nostoc sp.]|uniref:hypothetical protein n=1 Tax=Nostoc sp. TaxID=1180 RepID=UPI002FF97141
MGGEAYWYYTDYQQDINVALDTLRKREFQAGRYNPAIPSLNFPVTENSPTPGAQHPSIEAAIEAKGSDGTRSILDILRVSDTPCPLSRDEFKTSLRGTEENSEILGEVVKTAFPVPPAELIALFGTEQPTREMILSVIFGNTNSDAGEEDEFKDEDEFKAALRGGEEENYETFREVFNTAFPLPLTELVALFGTEQPTHEMIESVIFGKTNSDASNAFWYSIDRGTARYIIVYTENQPSEIFFIGYSFD